MLKDLKRKFKASNFWGYLVSCIATFLAPILLSIFFAWISSIAQGLPFRDVFIAHIFNQIIQSVLCLLIMVLIAHFLCLSKTSAIISKGWCHVLSGVAIVCIVIGCCLLVISTLYAANFHVQCMLRYYKIVVAAELLGASAGISVQCLTHTEVYVVV